MRLNSPCNSSSFICRCCRSRRLLRPDALWTSLATTTSSFADGAAPGVSYTQMLCCGLLWQRQQLHLLMMLLPASPTPTCAVDFSGNDNIFICCWCCSRRLLHPDAVLWTSLATAAASFADDAAPGVSHTHMRCGLLWQRQHLHLLMLLLLASPTPRCAVGFSGNDNIFICCCCSRRLPPPDALGLPRQR